MSPQLIIAVVIAIVSSGATWRIQSWYYASKEANHAKQTYETSLESQRLAFRAQSAEDRRFMDAQNAAAVRQRVLRNDADSARAALIGLSNDSARYLSGAADSHAACVDRASTLSELFVASAERYRDLAEKASRHTSDIQTLTEACTDVKSAVGE